MDAPSIDASFVLALLSGIALAAACGLRAFLPLLALGLAARFGVIGLRPGVAWLGSAHALWALGLATAIEIAGDKIPIVDHALDVAGTVVRPAAAWLGAFALFAAWPAPWAQIAAVVVGSCALGVHALKAHARIGSSALTLGSANPLVSLVEDALAFAATAIALFAPFVVLGLAMLVAWIVLRGARRDSRRSPC